MAAINVTDAVVIEGGNFVPRSSHYNLRNLQKVNYAPEKKLKGTAKRVYNRRVKRTKVNSKVSDEMFHVEKVIKRRGRKGHYQYLLKWGGYPDSANSWQPEENLTRDLVEIFQESLRQQSMSRANKIMWYAVERIMDKRLHDNGTMEFFVKWLNYPETQNSWEPVDFLKCPELIYAYECATSQRSYSESMESDEGSTSQLASQRSYSESMELDGGSTPEWHLVYSDDEF